MVAPNVGNYSYLKKYLLDVFEANSTIHRSSYKLNVNYLLICLTVQQNQYIQKI